MAEVVAVAVAVLVHMGMEIVNLLVMFRNREVSMMFS